MLGDSSPSCGDDDEQHATQHAMQHAMQFLPNALRGGRPLVGSKPPPLHPRARPKAYPAPREVRYALANCGMPVPPTLAATHCLPRGMSPKRKPLVSSRDVRLRSPQGVLHRPRTPCLARLLATDDLGGWRLRGGVKPDDPCSPASGWDLWARCSQDDGRIAAISEDTFRLPDLTASWSR